MHTSMASKTSAWPLTVMYALLVIFATLFPFSGWRAQGIDPLVFLLAPLPPPYWTGFDVSSNLVGYFPLGFLLALALLRTGWGRWGLVVAAGAGILLSLGLEFLQIYLPQRVPSNLDLSLNSAGAVIGALMAGALERWGVIDRWSHFKRRWFEHDSRGALVLLVLWPPALLFPAAVPFGLGQVLERLESAAWDWLDDSPLQAWLTVRETPMDPLSSMGEMWCVALGLLVPMMLGYRVVRGVPRRVVFGAGLVVVGLGVTALSAALTWGPVHAWDGWSEATLLGVAVACVVGGAAVFLPTRACAAIALSLLLWQLALLNQAPLSTYFSQTLQTWEQGRFIRFYGLGQWLGWLWPYAALSYLGAQIWFRDVWRKPV